MMAKARLVFCMLVAMILNAQRLVPIGGRSKDPIRAVIDSPDVRKMISEEERRRDEADRFWRESHTAEEKRQHAENLIFHPDEMLPGHKEFLEALAKASSISVPGKTRAQVMEISKARCLPDGLSTVTWARMVIAGKTSSSGTEVWVCINPYAFDAP
jgi:hypothetical protein